MASNFLTGLRDAANGAICRVLEDDERVQRVFRRNGVFNDRQYQLTRRLRRLLCSNDTEPTFSPESLPGRCPTEYIVSFEAECTKFDLFGDPEVTYIGSYSQQITGPLTDFVIELPGVRVGGIGNSSAPPISYALNGLASAGSFVGTSDPSLQKNNRDNQAIGPATNILITRLDGLPDDCAIAADPESQNEPGDITYINNNGDTVIVGGNFLILPPVINFNGELNIPVDVTIDDLSIPINININGDIEVPFRFDFPNGDDLTPDNNDESPDDDPNEDLPVLVGAVVVVNSIEEATASTIFQGKNPDIIIPRAGTVQFLQQAGERKAWCNDISVKNANAWIPCPPPGRAIAVAGTPNIGVEWTIYPVFERPKPSA